MPEWVFGSLLLLGTGLTVGWGVAAGWYKRTRLGPGDENGHRYLSTYCVHAKHGDCRITCKHCPSRCVCECHTDNWLPKPSKRA